MDELDEQIKKAKSELDRVTATNEKKKQLKELQQKILDQQPLNRILNNLIKKFK